MIFKHYDMFFLVCYITQMYLHLITAAGVAIRSLLSLTNVTMLATSIKPGNTSSRASNTEVKRANTKKEDNLVMDTKLKIIGKLVL